LTRTRGQPWSSCPPQQDLPSLRAAAKVKTYETLRKSAEERHPTQKNAAPR
jgi:hypothetical protein